MLDVFVDAILDSLMIFPFLLLVYILMEYIEHNFVAGEKLQKWLGGRYAPLAGAGLGLLPQCGFSVMSAGLYSKKLIGFGTLMAVFIATSDEAIPIMLSDPINAWKIFPVLGVKFIIALLAGFLLNRLFKREPVPVATAHAVPVPAEADTDALTLDAAVTDAEQSDRTEETACVCGHDHSKHARYPRLMMYFVHPLLHALKILAFIFLVNFLLSTIIYFVGEDKFEAFLLSTNYFQPLLAGVIGLIPNCASSVIITQLYMQEALAFGSVIAGLSVNAGVGLVVLFRQNKNLKENLFMTGLLFGIGVAAGSLILVFENLFF